MQHGKPLLVSVVSRRDCLPSAGLAAPTPRRARGPRLERVDSGMGDLATVLPLLERRTLRDLYRQFRRHAGDNHLGRRRVVPHSRDARAPEVDSSDTSSAPGGVDDGVLGALVERFRFALRALASASVRPTPRRAAKWGVKRKSGFVAREDARYESTRRQALGGARRLEPARVFEELDFDEDGMLEAGDLRRALARLDVAREFDISARETESGSDASGGSSSGRYSDERGARGRRRARARRLLRRLMRTMDVDRDGAVTAQDLGKFIRSNDVAGLRDDDADTSGSSDHEGRWRSRRAPEDVETRDARIARRAARAAEVDHAALVAAFDRRRMSNRRVEFDIDRQMFSEIKARLPTNDARPFTTRTGNYWPRQPPRSALDSVPRRSRSLSPAFGRPRRSRALDVQRFYEEMDSDEAERWWHSRAERRRRRRRRRAPRPERRVVAQRQRERDGSSESVSDSDDCSDASADDYVW